MNAPLGASAIQPVLCPRQMSAIGQGPDASIFDVTGNASTSLSHKPRPAHRWHKI
jgi:hypothetical protein